jgi:putative PIN family toxin of toxin-antitoxin system
MATRPHSLRVMLDANILIAGSVWPRWPYEILRHAVKGDFQLVLTPYIITEARDRLSKRFPDNAWRFERILLAADYERVRDPTKRQVQKHSHLVRDPTDVPIALAAIQSRVDYLVSEDKDLTVQDATTAELR